ncbi:MAG: ABC transporter permease subunit [Planctomycetales bacterium]|nr:ABC transporter permease subunit [Planctomycetales bacterium]NIM09476.1 ABC transporter permease subunit [Planctomycetales bacterium]NIN08964.1 ABC transporter permease subunit [Planctomycetales bacterium]NIN78079.1 ABC transporter permease subunit [Planctomycetales bacterium]NIO35257.1 ABC transporter permease subunit [Planctomycetales bacterium]
MSIRGVIVGVGFLLLACLPLSCRPPVEIVIGSKKFTESVVLGEIIAQLAQSSSDAVQHHRELGGTRLLFNALRHGDIDIYPEYTGTIAQEILAGKRLPDDQAIHAALQPLGIRISQPLGFNNTYALAMQKETAQRLGITTISDLTAHPQLRFRFSHEFIDRADGWPGLRQRYGLPQREVKGMDHDLAYRQLSAGTIDVIDAYTTDAKISFYDLQLLQDDRQHFPRYDAVLLYRTDLADRQPAFVASFGKLTGHIHEEAIRSLNARTELGGETETQVAADFLKTTWGLVTEAPPDSVAARIGRHTAEHLDLVRQSLIPAILVAIPLGIWAAVKPAAGQVILFAVGVVQTIPALALLVMLMTPVNLLGLQSVGGGSITAIVALFLYSLLPIVRNTATGLRDISPPVRESAIALGLPATARLRLIELPLASPTILAGVKTAAVINIGFATLGALIGAGGYGQPILSGIRLHSTSLILQGAIPAALLALLAQGGFELAERWLIPKGLRLDQPS